MELNKDIEPVQKRENLRVAILILLFFAGFLIYEQWNTRVYNNKIGKEKHYVLAKIVDVGKKGSRTIVYNVSGKEYRSRFHAGRNDVFTTGDYVLINIYKPDPGHFVPLHKEVPNCQDISLFQNIVFDSIPDNIENFCPFLRIVEFNWLVKNFDPVEFNSVLNISAENWPDFSKEQLVKITPYTAEKYLCGGDKNKMTKPSGSTYQYFTGQRISITDSLTGLIYYRVGEDWTGYQLAFFNKYGNLKDELFLSGTKGFVNPEAQKEATIFTDGKIIVTEIIPEDRHNRKGIFYAQCIEMTYWVKPDGTIETRAKKQFRKTVIENKSMHNRYESAGNR